MYKYVIGLMSGTSLDGLDIVYVRFNREKIENFTILMAETIPYTKKWKNKLKKAFYLSAEDLLELDVELGKYFAEQVNFFIQKNKITQIDLIASHGQTIFHRPEKGYTTQIGKGVYINVLTKRKTICDFRMQDVALSGQGAPLVPIGDHLLFKQYDYCLNIGGFANISFEKNTKRIAFDIVPANIVLNYYVAKLGLDFDDKGQIARAANINYALLNELNSLSFYQTDKPKSLGWEFVLKNILPLINRYSLDIPTILRTYVEHVSLQITKKIDKGTILVTGGGVYHRLLIERLQYNIVDAEIIIPEKKLIDYKEALIFALLGLLKDDNKINILSSVTGSVMDHSSGVIYDIFENKN